VPIPDPRRERNRPIPVYHELEHVTQREWTRVGFDHYVLMER
jgi:hypothetical protein